MKITADQLIMVAENKPNPVKYRLNSKTKPKQIDLLDRGDRVIPGIYDLNGDDLKICLVTIAPQPKKDKGKAIEPQPKRNEAARPKDFSADDANVLIVLKRDKK